MAAVERRALHAPDEHLHGERWRRATMPAKASRLPTAERRHAGQPLPHRAAGRHHAAEAHQRGAAEMAQHVGAVGEHLEAERLAGDRGHEAAGEDAEHHGDAEFDAGAGEGHQILQRVAGRPDQCQAIPAPPLGRRIRRRPASRWRASPP